MITLIDRYLLREVLKAMSAILLVLTLILSSNSFIKLLKEVATGELHAELLAQALALQMVVYFSRLIPPAFFFAVLYVVGRMYRDSEMVALESCGIGGMRIYRSMVLVVVPVALITGWLSLYVTPWAGRLSAELLSSQQGQAMELAGISAGRFNEYSQGDLVLYVESLDSDERRMQKVFVQQRREGALTLVSAKRGYQRIDNSSGDRYLVLEDGLRYAGIPGQADYQVSEFDEYALLIKASSGGEAKVTRRSLSSYDLLHSDSIKDRAEFQVRLSQVLGLLVFALLSLPLSRTLPRQGPFGRLVFAFVLYTVYLSLQGAAENWMIHARTPEWLGIWWVHLSLAIVGLLMLLPDTPPLRRLRRRLRSQPA
ncbi:MAG: LPS export ABC transporter permease LptF [Candidatus Thiodiazotropha sp. (ex. Lucinisca nassula)]|nr:LPS export ABC transporter permease LptF [Candidatus Thiodiazotropha sp. (ex. Lucinisca nassula)]MBW9263850.1 LPS export ABC transporter permease LptF [Candidatus Thiodiazotropha sp. (ex. Lucinisca nassula)]MBW9269174.1 LPS export ABC transporter permease LptF [Candidatus Thiodiazotropha sp. (ex. Lucinisca nassula)]